MVITDKPNLAKNGTFYSTNRLNSHTYVDGKTSFTLDDDSSSVEGYIIIRVPVGVGIPIKISMTADIAAPKSNNAYHNRVNTGTGILKAFINESLAGNQYVYVTPTQDFIDLIIYANDVVLTYSDLKIETIDSVFRINDTITDGGILDILRNSTPLEDVNQQYIITANKDSNGVVTFNPSYLQYTYGRDEINNLDTVMYREGYIKTNNNGWSKDNETVIPLLITQGLNKGAYHPWLNSLGSATLVAYNSTPVVNGGSKWYTSADADTLANRASFLRPIDAFNLTQDDSSCCDESGAFVGNVHYSYTQSYISARPDGKKQDMVYLSDSIDVRVKANERDDMEILKLELENDKSGITKGIGGNTCYKETNMYIYLYSDNEISFYTDKRNNSLGSITTHPVAELENLMPDKIYFTLNGILREGTIVGRYNGYIRYSNITPPIEDFTTVGTTYRPIKILVDGISVNKHLSSGTSTVSELIGNPDNYPNSLKDMLVNSDNININLSLSGQDGTDYTTNTGTFQAILSEKNTSNLVFTNLSTTDHSAYSEDTLDMTSVADNTDYTAGGSTTQTIKQYTAHNSILHPYTEGVMLTKELIVYASNNHDVTKGALIANSLTGNVNTGTDILEELSITKNIGDVTFHTTPTQTPTVLFRVWLERDIKTNKKKIVYGYSSNVINGTQKMQRILNEY